MTGAAGAAAGGRVLRAVGGGSAADKSRSIVWAVAETCIAARGEPPPACGLCFGTGHEVVEGRGARRCECKRAEDRERLVGRARIPEMFKGCTLANFEPAKGNVTHLSALAQAHQLVGDYPDVEAGLLLVGPCGVGKTHLAAAILNGLLAKGVGCLFYEFGALLKRIQDSYNRASGSTEMGVLEEVYRAEVLLLDELGAARPTDWVRDTMMQIINTRYNEKRLTIFTSNYSDPPGGPAAGTGPAAETLADRVGIRMRSRLYRMCRLVRVDGEDCRKAQSSALS